MSNSESSQTNISPRRNVTDWYAVIAFVAGVLGLLSRCVRADSFAFYEDDFFYYTQPARNWVLHGISSFDGIHLTNGYHPLWFLTIAAIYKAVPESAFLWAVQTVSLALLMALYFFLRNCTARLAIQTSMQRPVALLITLQALLIFRYGMEMIIALPLGVAIFAYTLSPGFRWTDRQCIIYGLLAALTVLGRLDNIFLVALLLVGQILATETEWGTRFRRVVFYGIGFLPFAFYLLINLHYFHVLMPVSGSAKQLKPLLPPSPVAWISLVHPMDRMKMTFVLPALAMLAYGIVLFLRHYRSLTPNQRAVYGTLLAFPIVQLSALSTMSDWIVWPWYYYVFCYSTLAACALALRPIAAPATHSVLPRFAFIALSAYYLIYVSVYSVKKAPDQIAMLGGHVAEYARTHPGIYAIGDEAGAPGWFSGQPVIQLEGLMMDAEYLQTLRTNPTLRQILDRYHAQYYSMMLPTGTQPVDGCYTTHEPSQAGPMSLHIVGKVCGQPVYVVDNGIGVSSYIFKAADVR